MKINTCQENEEKWPHATKKRDKKNWSQVNTLGKKKEAQKMAWRHVKP